MKVEIKKDSNWFSIELITSNELLIKIDNDDELKTCLYEKIIHYEALDLEVKYLFQNIKEVYDALSTLVVKNSNEDFLVESNGRVHFGLDVKIFQKLIKKKVVFNLQNKLRCQQEVHILRANLYSARREINYLREGFAKLVEENNQLKSKYTYLEELIMTKISSKYEQKSNETKYLQNTSSKRESQEFITNNKQQTQIQTEIEEQKISEEDLKVKPFKVQIDQKCMYYDKFVIANNKISTIHEDYYQIYCKEPLPKRGVYNLKVKFVTENHLSIGILGKSALNNQYSFQNSKAICFYSYYYGNFRGIYFRSKYEPLNWLMEVGQVIDFVIDMNEKLIKIGSKERPTVEIVNFKSLYDEQPVYFFVEMYEKNNTIEFLQ